MKMSEKDFSTQIEGMFDSFGWRWTHFRPARTIKGWRTPVSGHPGFPDYVATRPPRVIVAELKSEEGTTSMEQREWIADFRACGIKETYVWKPSMSDEIEAILR